MSDVTFGLRQLRKTPIFTLTAVFSLALGIGATTAIFTLINEFLLRSLPVKNPEELVLFRAVHGVQGRMSHRAEGPGSVDLTTRRNSGTPLPLLVYERFQTQRSVLADVLAFAPFSQIHVVVDGVPETTVSGQMVSGTYYSSLGLPALLGRVIMIADDRPAAPPVAVISHRFWQRRFEGDPAVLGETILINRVAATIIGVTPPGFEGALQAGETADITVPLGHHARFEPDRAERQQPWYWWVRVMGRLRPGVTAAEARASLEPVFQLAAREGWIAGSTMEPGRAMPDDPGLAVDPGAQGEREVRRQYARSLELLMGLVGLLLAAACANVANVLVARGDARGREIAVRLAIGARRQQIVKQLLVESLILAGAGAVIGIVFAWWSRDVLLALRPFGNTTVVLDLTLDRRVLGFTLGLAVATALAFGLAPALRATRIDLSAAFQGGARAIAGRKRSRLARSLMIFQVAVSMVLLVGTGLFTRTLNLLQEVDAGFNHRNLILFRLDATAAGYSREQAVGLHVRIQERLEALPGARAATFSRVPLLSRSRQHMTFSTTAHAPTPGAPLAVNTNGIAPNFFEAMQLPLMLGRGFSPGDDERSPRVAVVNQAFVRTYFGGEDPMGRELVFSAPNFGHRVTIVGVARDAKYTDLRGATPATVYFPAAQQPDGTANFAVRSQDEPAAMFAAIRRAVQEVDPMLPVLNLRTQTEQLERLHGQERLFAHLSGFFGVMALALACVGLYGLGSQGVLRRTREFGLRLALGARPAQVLRMVIRESVTLASLGVAVGIAAAYGSTRLVATMLFGVSAADPLTYGGVALMLLGTAVLASVIPAYRASRIQPLQALRVT